MNYIHKRFDILQLNVALRDAGVNHFRGHELLDLRNARARKRVGAGKRVSLPREYAQNAIAVGLMLEIIRAKATRISGKDHPIRVLSGYRPGRSDSLELGFQLGRWPSYNVAATGTDGSAHERCAAADIRSGIGEHKALHQAAVEFWLECPWATGLGRYLWGRWHVEILHAGGKLARQWSKFTRPALSHGITRSRRNEQRSVDESGRSYGRRVQSGDESMQTIIDDLTMMLEKERSRV